MLHKSSIPECVIIFFLRAVCVVCVLCDEPRRLHNIASICDERILLCGLICGDQSSFSCEVARLDPVSFVLNIAITNLQ